MKSHRCWDEVVAPDRLWLAWRAFSKRKRRRPDVAEFAIDADRRVLALSRALCDKRWTPGGYRLLRITDPKRRLIAAASVADRVVHTALHRALAPQLDRRFIEHSYACLDGRGTHRALLPFLGRLQRHRWVLQLDIRRYFYSIPHDRLRALLHPRLSEPAAAARRSVDRQRARPVRPTGGGRVARVGATAGPRLRPAEREPDQWWGNQYLDGLDHYVLRTLRPAAYQRYMDDLTLFDPDADRLAAHRDAIRTWLDRERGLALKDPEAPPEDCRKAVHYLGYRVTRDGFRIGPKAAGRISAHVANGVRHPRKLGAIVHSVAAVWMF